MATFNNGESLASVRTKINDAIDKIDGNATISNDISVGGNITVTGTATADGLTVDGNQTLNGDLKISDVAAFINMVETDVTDLNTRLRSANGDFYIETINDALNSATIRLNVDHATGDIKFYDTSGSASFVYDESAGSTFNEQGADRDFRVESDTNANALLVDGATGNVGISTNDISNAELTIRKDGTTATSLIRTQGATAGTYHKAMLSFELGATASGTRDYDIYADDPSNNGGYLEFAYEGNPRLTLKASGTSTVYGPVDGMTQLTLTDDGYVDVSIFSYGTTAGSSIVGFRADGTQASPTNAKQGQTLLGLQGRGYDGSNFSYTNTALNIIASEDFTPTAKGQSIYMDVVANGTTSARRAITVSNGPDGVIFNDSGFGRDVRAESVNYTHAFFLDADTDRVSLRSTTPQGVFQIQNTSHNATVTSVEGSLIFNHLRGTYVDGEWHSPLEWAQPNSNGGTPSTIMAAQMDGGGSQKSFGIFSRDNLGNISERIAFELTETVINNDSANLDFRVEGGTLEHLLFVDAGANKVGINDNDPVTRFVVRTGGADGITIEEDQQDSTQSGRLFWATGTAGEHTSIYARNNAFNFQTDATAGLSSGVTRLNIYGNGAGNAVVVNEAGSDIDFRVESDTNTHALFVDAAESSVSINSSNMQATGLHVSGTTNSEYRTLFVTNTADVTKGVAIAYDTVNDRGVITSVDSGVGWKPLYIENTSLTIDNALTVNEAGNNNDFRVESDFHTHALFVDASTDMVGIDQTAPSYGLDVGNGAAAWPSGYTLRINSNGDTIFSHSRQSQSLMSFRNDQALYTCIASNNGANLMLGYSASGAGAIANHLFFTSAETVVNEASADRDFRVESDSNAHLFYVDGQSGFPYVAIGASSGGGQYAGTGSNGFSVNQAGMAGQYVTIQNQTDANLYLSKASGYTSGVVASFWLNGSAKGNISIDASGTTYNTTSDRRLKDNIEPIADGTEKLMAMKPVTHTWKADPEADAVHGFIAQEMQEIVPEAVSGDPDGEEMMSMDYGRITPVLVAALQDAHRKIDELKAEITAMKEML